MAITDILLVFTNPLYLTILAIGLAIGHYVQTYVAYRHGNCPPMPCRPVPFLGHVVFLKPSPLDALMDWRRRLGDVTSFYIGSNMYVALSSVDVIKEAFVKKAGAFSERPDNFFMRSFSANDEGKLVGLSGPDWRQQRNVSLSILKSFGMGKNKMADIINEEVIAFKKELLAMKGEAKDLRSLTYTAVSNVVCALLIGQRFEYDDEYFIRLNELLAKKVSLLMASSVIDLFWWLEYLPGDFFGARTVKKISNEIYHSFSFYFINKFQNELDDHSNDNFIKAYLRQGKSAAEDGADTHFDVENLSRIIDIVFEAGTETTSNTIQWALLFSMHYPDTQRKVFEEIKSGVGLDRLPTIEDKSSLKYTHAFVLETQRRCSIGPFGVPHICTETSEVGGYTIPKGTLILAHLDALLKDDKTWNDPMTFRPERFLDQDGNISIPDEFIPFGVGRRVCLGESLAKMELFLFLSAILQRFEVLPDDPSNNLPSLEPDLGLSACPKPFSVRLVDRMK